MSQNLDSLDKVTNFKQTSSMRNSRPQGSNLTFNFSWKLPANFTPQSFPPKQKTPQSQLYALSKNLQTEEGAAGARAKPAPKNGATTHNLCCVP